MVKDKKIPDSLARLFKLFSDPNRIRILFAIGKAKKSVSEIMSQTALSQTLVSFHLRPLRESGIVAAERQGLYVYYRATEPVLIDLLLSLPGFPPGDRRSRQFSLAAAAVHAALDEMNPWSSQAISHKISSIKRGSRWKKS